jgi:endonuclease I
MREVTGGPATGTHPALIIFFQDGGGLVILVRFAVVRPRLTTATARPRRNSVSYRFRRAHLAGLSFVCASLAMYPAASSGAEVPDATWTNYGTYYNSAAGLNGVALRTQLFNIVSTGDVSISYDAEKIAMPILDRVYGTTAAQKQMWGAYDRVVLNGVWDSAATWNREHVWPASKLGTNSDHDMFGLRAAAVASNGDRANYGYGGYNITDTTTQAGLLPKASGATNPLFYAGPYDRGDTARACFYMATRYYIPGSPNNTNSLKIVATNDGYNPDGTLGDLNSMLRANYLDMPDNFERRRNQLIYNNTENASLSQKNRNPYIDNPEMVWSVFGDGANDSKISVATPLADGTSSRSISLGRTIVGGTLPSLNTSLTINKSGVDPTTFSVTTSGAATADGTSSTVRSNKFNAFDYNAGSKSLAIGLTGASAATAGRTSGTIVLDNTDLTNAGSGTGALDGNDTVNLSVDVLDHSNASFAGGSDANALTINFGAVNKGQTATQSFNLYNLLSASGYTAGLDLDSITATGDTGMFASGLNGFSALTAGGSNLFMASFTPTGPGTFAATYTLGVSDENLSGATAGTSLTLTLTGVTNSFTVPEPAFLAIAPLLAMVLRRRRAA